MYSPTPIHDLLAGKCLWTIVADDDAGVRFSAAFACLSVFRTMYERMMHLGSSKCSTMSPGNPFILGSKGQRSRSQVTINIVCLGFCILVSAGLF